MAADGVIQIDLLLNGKDAFLSDIQSVNELLKKLGLQTAEKMDDAFNAQAQGLKQEAKETKENLDNTFSKPSKTKLEADTRNVDEKLTKEQEKFVEFSKEKKTKLVALAEEQGVHQFETILKELPHEKRVELKASLEEGKFIDFKELLASLPKEKKTKLEADTTNVDEATKRVSKEVNETKRHFISLKDIIAGTFAGGLITMGVQNLVGGLKTAAAAGMEYNKEQDTMKTVWKSLTEETPKDGQQLVGFINDVSNHSIYASDSINRMAQSFYHVHSNADETKKWTESLVALGSTLHMTDDRVAEAGETFSKVMASGKAGAQDIYMMINRFPMFGEALQKVTGKTMEQLYKLSAQGKLTSDDFGKAMDYLGNKYKDGTKEAMTSMQGMGMYISKRWQQLWGEAETTTFSSSKRISKSLENLLSDKQITIYANALSNAFSGVLDWVTKVMDYLDKHKNTILSIIGNIKTIAGIFASTVWSTIKDIFFNIADHLGLVAKNGEKSKDPLKMLGSVLSNVAKHKDAIKIIANSLLALFAAKKIGSFISNLSSISKVLKAISGFVGIGKLFTKAFEAMTLASDALDLSLLANPLFWIPAAIIAVGVAFYEAYKHIEPFHKAVDNAVKAVKNFGDAIIKNAKKALDWVKNNWKEIGLLFVNPIAGIVTLLYKNNSGFRKWANDIIKSILDGLKSGWTNITGWLSNIKKTISKDIDSFLTPIVKGIQELSKPIIKAIQKICKDVGLILEVGFWLIWGPIRLLGQQIEKGIGKLWKWIQPYISKTVNAVGDIIGKLVGIVQGVWNKLNKITQKALNIFGKYIVDPIKSAANKARDAINWLKDKAIDIFNVLSKATKKVFDTLKRYIINPINDAKNKVISLVKNIWDSIVSRFDSLCQETNKIWQKIRSMIITPITDTWHKVTKVVSNLFDDVMKWWDHLKDGTIKKWDQMLSYVAGIPKKMGDALKSGAHWVGDGAKAIGNYMIGKIGDGVNGVIGGIDWVLDKVHAPKSVRLPKWEVPQFATGGTHSGGLMMVNDGEGPELVRHPNGQIEIPKGQNVIMQAEPGTQVLNHQQTKMFAQLTGIPMYANGVGNFFSGIWDGIKGIGEDIATAVAHPIKFVKKAIAKHVNLDATHPVLDIAIGGVKTMADGAMDWIKKLIGKFGSEFLDSNAPTSGPPGAGVERWKDLVKKALDANGLSTSGAMIDCKTS
ncbi:tape measure protein [Melissococcus plutonius]|uniref:tape measure protein n=1 Tax=Melissococcus plutonius TaxID=33970 RepID=UPI003EE5FFC2